MSTSIAPQISEDLTGFCRKGYDMNPKPLRIAVMGAGWFASRRHLPDLMELPDVQVAAACRRDQDALARFCDHFNIPGRFSDYGQMLDATRPDAVVIASPHALHFEQTAECLRRGVHVLVEKPLALKAVDAEQLAALAANRGLTLAVALNPPYWRHCHLLRDWIAEGRIGRLEAVEIVWLNCAAGLFGKEPLPERLPGIVRPTGFRSDPELGGGGHLMDGGQHNISELLWVTGATPSAVSAAMDQLPVDLRASVSISLKNGAIASVTGLADSRLGTRRAHSAYYGSEGTLRLSVAPFRVTLERQGADNVVVDEHEMPVVLSPAADLVRCIRSGAAPLGTAAHAIETTRVIEMAYQSAARQTGSA